VQEALEQIVKDGHRINDVIASVRAMFGTETAAAGLVDVGAVTDEVLALVRGELESHEILLRKDMDGGLPEVRAERVQLQQVLLNLITNAIEAMSAVSGRERQLTITSVFDEQAGVKVTVEDTGGGIDPVHLDRIFDTFFTTKTHGMGLGLSICRSIIEAHGGRLWASSRSPFGTAFHLTLPVAATEDRTNRAALRSLPGQATQ
jgi:signal transduction histidine kinase